MFYLIDNRWNFQYHHGSLIHHWTSLSSNCPSATISYNSNAVECIWLLIASEMSGISFYFVGVTLGLPSKLQMLKLLLLYCYFWICRSAEKVCVPQTRVYSKSTLFIFTNNTHRIRHERMFELYILSLPQINNGPLRFDCEERKRRKIAATCQRIKRTYKKKIYNKKRAKRKKECE